MEPKSAIHAGTIQGMLKEKVAKHGNREFLYFGDRVFGYEDLDKWSDKTASGFQSLGVQKGDKVAIIMMNRPEFLFTWFGLCKLGAVEVPLNVVHRGAILSYMLDKSDSRFVVVQSAFLPQLLDVLPSLSKIEKIVVLDAIEPQLTRPNIPIMDFSELAANNRAYTSQDVTWKDPFCISYTSGTTGPSKGALMPHNYAVFMAELLCECAEYSEKDCLYNALPLFHGNAQLLSTMPALLSGAKMVLAPRFSAGAFWDDVRKYKCTAFNYIGIIPPIMLQAEPKADDGDNPLRIMLGGGCPLELIQVMEKRFNLTMVEGYGLSELGIPIGNSIGAAKRSSMGRVADGYQVKLVNDEGEEVEVGEIGEILVRVERPYSIMLEYYNMPAETVEAWRDLWFHTGDLAVKDDEGYFKFVDRKKDAIRRRGENISSWEVEKIVNSHQAIAQCAAIAIKSEMSEDEVMVCVVKQPNAELTPEDLLDYCRDNMADFMAPRYVRFMDQLPQTPTLRVQKAVLRQEGVTPDTWDREAAGYSLQQ